MATIKLKANHVQHGVLQSVWTSMGGADVGAPDQLARYPYHSVQFVFTVGGSATAVLEGSDDGVNWFTLTGENPVGGADVLISTTSSQRFDFTNVPLHIRPKTSGGTGSDITVIITSRSFGH